MDTPSETAADAAIQTSESLQTEQNIALSYEAALKQSIDAGIPPLTLEFDPIYGCSSGTPIAYRTHTTVRSVVLGSLREDMYTPVSDRAALAQTLLMHSLQHAAGALKAFAAAERHVDFCSVRCPDTLVETGNLYRAVSKILSVNPSLSPESLCLEFPAELLTHNLKRVARAVTSIKSLRVKTAIVGCGAEDFPVMKLTEAAPDLVFLDSAVTKWAGNRDKPQLFGSFVSYLRSMNIAVFVEAKADSNLRRQLSRADCEGYLIPGAPSLSQEEAVAQKEED